MDKFREWLDTIFKTPAWVCEETGIQPSYLSRFMNGKQNLGLDYVEKIYQLSEGDIGLEDLRPDLYKKYKNYGCLKDIL